MSSFFIFGKYVLLYVVFLRVYVGGLNIVLYVLLFGVEEFFFVMVFYFEIIVLSWEELGLEYYYFMIIL